MAYQKHVQDGYIISIACGVENGNMTEEEYRKIRETIEEKPNVPQGYAYRLKDSLEWELYELSQTVDADE